MDCSAAQEVLDTGPAPVLLLQLAGRDGVNRKPLLLTRRSIDEHRPATPLTEIRRPSPPAGPRPTRAGATARAQHAGAAGEFQTVRGAAAAEVPLPLEAAPTKAAEAARIAREILPAMGRVARSRRLRPVADAFEVRQRSRLRLSRS